MTTTLALSPRRVTRNVPEGWSEFPCSLCGCVIVARDDDNTVPTCPACHRMQAEKAVHEALCVIRDLRKGAAPFHILSPAERGEQLLQILADDDPTPPPVLVRVSVKSLCDAKLIDLIANTGDVTILAAATAELAARMEQIPAVCQWQVASLPARRDTGADAPDAATRDELESRIELTVEADGDQMDADRWDCAA